MPDFLWTYFSYSRCFGFCDRNVKTHLILWGSRIVSNIPPNQHTIPADVLPNDSEDLFARISSDGMNRFTNTRSVIIYSWLHAKDAAYKHLCTFRTIRKKREQELVKNGTIVYQWSPLNSTSCRRFKFTISFYKLPKTR